jgi:hypothetical protein
MRILEGVSTVVQLGELPFIRDVYNQDKLTSFWFRRRRRLACASVQDLDEARAVQSVAKRNDQKRDIDCLARRRFNADNERERERERLHRSSIVDSCEPGASGLESQRRGVPRDAVPFIRSRPAERSRQALIATTVNV